MTLPTGSISLWEVNIELGRPGGQSISLNDSAVRALSGQPGGAVDMYSLRGKSSYTPMTVTPISDYQSYYSADSGGTAAANPSVSVTGGSGGYSYSWSFVSNSSGLTMNGGNYNVCSVYKTYNRYSMGSWGATLQCVVTDNTGHSVAVQVNCGADWDDGR
jgi:hypothetical protein